VTTGIHGLSGTGTACDGGSGGSTAKMKVSMFCPPGTMEKRLPPEHPVRGTPHPGYTKGEAKVPLPTEGVQPTGGSGPVAMQPVKFPTRMVCGPIVVMTVM
jgi:hypothetical protein